jgi:hypothetical protein
VSAHVREHPGPLLEWVIALLDGAKVRAPQPGDDKKEGRLDRG